MEQRQQGNLSREQIELGAPPRAGELLVCYKCHGTGKYGLRGRCFTCGGLGKILRKEPPQGTQLQAKATAGLTKMEEAFNKAKAHGLKRPKMRFSGYGFSPAGETSRNPGAIYVKDDQGTYLGKVMNGKLSLQREQQHHESNVLKLLENPLEEMVAYGKRTGECGICGLELTNYESIDRGIGPICFEKFFGG